MGKCALLLALAGCVTARGPAPLAAHLATLPRADGSSLSVLVGEPEGPAAYPLVVYLDGSGCGSVANAAHTLIALRTLGYAYAAPEKRGVSPGDGGAGCSGEFLATNDRGQRLADARVLVAEARGLFPRWDGRLVLVGASEGGAVAAGLATERTETKAVVLFAAGGLAQAEELRLLSGRQLEARGASEAERAAARRELEVAFEAIRASPTSDQTWRGEDNTFKRWASYLWYAPGLDLARLAVPIYVVHGTGDSSTPVESSDAIAETLGHSPRAQLTYRRVEGLDHTWRDAKGTSHRTEVLARVIEWLLETVPPAPREGG